MIIKYFTWLMFMKIGNYLLEIKLLFNLINWIIILNIMDKLLLNLNYIIKIKVLLAQLDEIYSIFNNLHLKQLKLMIYDI